MKLIFLAVTAVLLFSHYTFGECKAPSLSLFREITPKLLDFSYTDEDLIGALINPSAKSKFDDLEPAFTIYLTPAQSRKKSWEKTFCKGKLDLEGKITNPAGVTYKLTRAVLLKEGRKLEIASEEINKTKYEFDGSFYEKPVFDKIYIDFTGTLKFYREGVPVWKKDLKFTRWTLH